MTHQVVLDGTQQVSSLRNNPTALVIELDKQSQPPPQTQFLLSARTGSPHMDYSDHFAPPSGTGSDPYARLRASRMPQISVAGSGHLNTTGTLKADDLVWTNSMTEWNRADKALPGLFSGEGAATSADQSGLAVAPVQLQTRRDRSLAIVGYAVFAAVVAAGLAWLITQVL